MYNLLLVEDDEIIKEGLVKNINWYENNINIVDTAENGLEGYELVKTYKPHIVITDIKMPFMDGIQLAGKIKEFQPKTKVIILTGYDDFKYAKEAVNLKIDRYILKYAENKEILAAVVSAAKELQKEELAEFELEEAHLVLKNKYFHDLIKGTIDDEAILSKAESLGFKFKGKLFCTAVIRINDANSLASLPKEKSIDLETEINKVTKICKEVLEKYNQGIYTNFDNEVNILFNFDESDEPVSFLEKVIDEINHNLELSVTSNFTIGISSIMEQINNITHLYNEARMALESRCLLGLGSVIYISNIKEYNQSSHNAILKRITKFIENNYYKEDLSLDDIANEVYISTSYISTLFKKYKGINFSDYITKLRINKASELLINTDMKIYEISNKVGYSNSQYFSVLFKDNTKYTPTQFRLKNKKD